MAKNDHRLIEFRDIAHATALLSRIPVPASHSDRANRAAWAYPLVGFALGGVSALVGVAALALDLGPAIAALCALASSIITTGALHEDGLADTADGLWGGYDKARRLEIMKDSHIGTYGVLALIFAVGLRWAALHVILQQDNAVPIIVTVAVLSRSGMPMLMALLPHARDTGLSHAVGHVPLQTAGLAVALAVSTCVLLLGSGGLVAMFLACLTFAVVAWVARAKVGGQTGDILGASQQCAEIVLLLALTI